MPDDDCGVDQVWLGVAANSKTAVGLSIEKGAIGRIEADIAGGYIARETEDPEVVAIATDSQPLTAPVVKPPMICFWAIKNVATIGAAPMSAAAARLPHLAE